MHCSTLRKSCQRKTFGIGSRLTVTAEHLVAHNRDVETLVANYLITSGLCGSVWSGSRAFEEIDHAGYAWNGQELLAQTTVSTKLVSNKAAKLLRMALPNRTLHFFGPAEAEDQCPEPIEYHSIEAIFSELDQTNAGRWLIDRMLNSGGSSSEGDRWDR